MALVCVLVAVEAVQLEPFLVIPLIFIFRANLLASVSSPLSPLVAVGAAAVSPALPFRLIITFVFDGTLLLLLLCSTFVCTLLIVAVVTVDDFFELEFLEAIAFVELEDVGGFLLRCSEVDVAGAVD